MVCAGQFTAISCVVRCPRFPRDARSATGTDSDAVSREAQVPSRFTFSPIKTPIFRNDSTQEPTVLVGFKAPGYESGKKVLRATISSRLGIYERTVDRWCNMLSLHLGDCWVYPSEGRHWSARSVESNFLNAKTTGRVEIIYSWVLLAVIKKITDVSPRNY